MNKVDYFIDEIEYIKSPSRREDIKYLINLLPDYFFEIPASSTGKYHPLFAESENGLVKHTKVAVRIAHDLFETISNFTDTERDLIIMALMMHDGLKKGDPEEEYTRFDHPLLVSAMILKHAKELKMPIEETRLMCSLIETHMGKWNTSKYSNVVLPLPQNVLQKFVHRCDYLASRSYLDVQFEKTKIKER